MLFSAFILPVALLASSSAAGLLQHSFVHSHAHSHAHKHRDLNVRNLTERGVPYPLRDTYTASNFFSSFNFFDGADPTHGYVSYQNEANARAKGLINTNNNQIYMGVDTTTFNPPAGRASVRVESKKSYNHGLFVLDIQHMPGSACGIWPAYWLFGPDWPGSGEIDIIEGVHRQSTNAITMHTAPGCYADWSNSRGGTYGQDPNCNANTAFTGCSAVTNAPFGDKFNAGSGGVYAMQWESSGIYIWFFPRNAIPADIKALKPVTSNWGTPLVTFNGGGNCNIDKYFRNQNIIFDTTFCGDWAGNTWGSSGCASKAPTCNAYVGANPAAFKTGYWRLNSLRVYQF